MTNNTDAPIEVINEYLTIEQLYDGKITVLNATSIKRHVVDAWADKMEELLLNLPSGKTLLTLHDYSATGNFVTTPHLRQRAKENVLLRPDVNALTAVVLPNNILMRIPNMFLRALPTPRQSSRIRRIFYTRADALAWLVEALDEA